MTSRMSVVARRRPWTILLLSVAVAFIDLTVCYGFIVVPTAPTKQQGAAAPPALRPSSTAAASLQAVLHVVDNKSNIEPIPTVATQQIDPILMRMLLQQQNGFTTTTTTNDKSIGNNNSSNINLQMLQASRGIAVWRSVLLKGRLPVPGDFAVVVVVGTSVVAVEESSSSECWPPEPLFASVTATMAALQLPRFVLRHPETATAVLLCLFRLVSQFSSAQRQRQQQREQQLQLQAAQQIIKEADDDDDDDFSLDFYYSDETVEEFQEEPKIMTVDTVDWEQQHLLSPEELALLADDVANGLVQEFGGVVAGMHILDQLFGGYNNDNRNAMLGGDDGIGLQDGIWQHSGWKVLPALQKQVSSMSALRDLLNSLGRRSTVLNSNGLHKFAPRKKVRDAHGGMMGAELDAVFARDSVTGLTLSSSLTEMLPSEAVLLKGSPALRRLFWAKVAESKLLSYQVSGWTDVNSLPRPKRPLRRTPSAPGGPIIVCLDTSWSMMSGSREWLSKAVVMACASAAHKQGRTCRVVAFSKGVMDAGEIQANAAGIRHLLDFLSNSFGGGTDVTGALKHTMTVMMGTTAAAPAANGSGGGEDGSDGSEMAAADLLLITDGEIPDPPISVHMMEQLDRLKRRTGMQVHGLLVGDSKKGENKNKALEKLCTQTHDFLIGYDMPRSSSSSSSTRSSALSAALHHRHQSRTPLLIRSGWSIRATGSSRWQHYTITSLSARKFDDGDYPITRKGSRNRQIYDDFDAELSDETSHKISMEDGRGDDAAPGTDSFSLLVDDALERIRIAVASESEYQTWKVSVLENEKDAIGSCWRYREQFRDAVSRVSENLVEREEESRLVVLGMAAGEHVLFLGPPGTGKSALGRRLSKICGGLFFQRLLTRFTTPEEIFGPLSLRALENDEYKRCTDGFLPKASVAFLDEIFKANSAILNTLLTILNERQFDNGAGRRENCPIRCVIAASNELPESDELDALYDRFLLRKEVLPVSDDGIVQMLGLVTPGSSPCDVTTPVNASRTCEEVFVDGLDKVVEALSIAADSVHMGNEACFLLRDLRTFMRDDMDVDISDRRLVKAARLLKVSAASHGRTRVDPIDCLLLQHMAWRLPEHRIAVREWLWDNLTPGSVAGGGSTASQFNLLLNGLRQETLVAVRKTSGDVTGATGARESDVAVIESIRSEVSQLASLLQQQSENLARHIELLRRSMDHLWLDPDEARAAQQLLIPKAEVALRESKLVLSNARSLELALKFGSSPSDEARLSVIEQLWDDEDTLVPVKFSEDELNISMKDAKAKYDADTFRRWKRERKKAGIK